MAPRKPYKVHSLQKHIEETKKNMSADKTSLARTPIKEPASVASFFDHNSDDDTSSSSSSSSDDSDTDTASFMKKLAAKSQALKRRGKGEEIADSEVERASAPKDSKSAGEAATPIKAESFTLKMFTSGVADSESSEEDVRPDGAAQNSDATSPTSSSGSDSDSSSSSEASSSDDGSDGESESESVPVKAAAAVKKSADKPSLSKQPESDSDNSTSEKSVYESDDDSQPASKLNSKPVANGVKTTTTKAKAIENDNSSDETSEEESSEEESSEEESSDGSQDGANSSDTESVDESTHELRKSGQDVARICKEAISQGKQFFFFTLPAGVPMSLVETQENNLGALQQGDSIICHNGENYGVALDNTAPKKSFKILIPASKRSAYKPSRQTVDGVVQIRGITQIGVTTATPAAVGSPIKIARSQPTSLKPSFQPMNFTNHMNTLGDGASNGRDVEMHDAPANGSTLKGAQKGKKHTGGASDPKKTAKMGKRKHSDSEYESDAAAERLMEESVSAVTKSKKQKTTRRASLDLGSPVSVPAVRQTAVVPPAIPASSATLTTVSTPVKKTKTNTKSSANPETPVRSAQVPGSMRKETPVPVPVIPGWKQSAATASATAKKSAKNQRSAIATKSPS